MLNMPYITNSDKTQLTYSATECTVAADQQQVEPRPILVGPTTADEFNTIGERLIPKGCFRFEDVTFEYDSSFVLPRVGNDMRYLADLIDKNTITLPGTPVEKIRPPLSIFGHADPVGNDDYNKQLSGRRAQAIYGMLVRDENLWNDLFLNPLPSGHDNWGNAAIQTMLDKVSPPPKSQDEATETQTQDRVKAFQADKGLDVDGIVGPETRKALYRAYMDVLCGPLELDKDKDFLGHNKDAGGKGDYQGCGEFNPVIMFSQEKNDEYEKAKDKTERNQENQPNRRVMVLLFAPGRRVNPQLWPCPRVKEGVSTCKKRFFLDAPKRRSFQEKRREFADTKDTFACRFYQLITDDSPCECYSALFNIRLYDLNGKYISEAPCRVTLENQAPYLINATEKGIISLRDIATSKSCLLEWGFKPKNDEEPELIFALNMLIISDEEDEREEIKKKLNNLGYTSNEQKVNIEAFQRDYGHLADPPLEANGKLNEQTKELLRDVYKKCALDLRNTPPK